MERPSPHLHFGSIGSSDSDDKRTLELYGHVGFDTLPDQVVNKAVAQGFCFNILCVGLTGIGKSTLMNTLFDTVFENDEASHYHKEVSLRPQVYELKESNVNLKLTIVQTVGFGDQINQERSAEPIIEYVDVQFKKYLEEELKIKRSLWNYHDTRIHVCLYFIAPYGHSLKALDLVTMKKLDSKVNIIPIIAKADTVTKNELQRLKSKVMSELVNNDVQIYQFPTEDDAFAEINASMNALIPFAVVGSNEDITVGSKTEKGRDYPWGCVQVENENHCDFVRLREMLLRINMEDLREQTHYRHYEMFRRCKLEEMGFSDNSPGGRSVSLEKTYESKMKDFLKELQNKEESMRQMFLNKVKEAEADLKDKERVLHRKFEQLKASHQEQKKSLEDKKRELEEEIKSFHKKQAGEPDGDLATQSSTHHHHHHHHHKQQQEHHSQQHEHKHHHHQHHQHSQHTPHQQQQQQQQQHHHQPHHHHDQQHHHHDQQHHHHDQQHHHHDQQHHHHHQQHHQDHHHHPDKQHHQDQQHHHHHHHQSPPHSQTSKKDKKN